MGQNVGRGLNSKYFQHFRAVDLYAALDPDLFGTQLLRLTNHHAEQNHIA